MSFINNLNGNAIKETAVLLELGVQSAVTGNTYVLNDSVRRAVRALDGKTIYMEMGNRKGAAKTVDTADHNNVCGELTNVRLVENRANYGHAVIVGDVRPFGPHGVVLRDVIAGASGSEHYHYSLNSLVRKTALTGQDPDENQDMKLSIAEFTGCNLVAGK